MKQTRFGRAIGAAFLLATWTIISPASAQTLQQVKDAFEIMVGSAAMCSEYLGRPEVLEDNRRLGRGKLVEAGMSEAEADAFMDAAAATALAEASNEMQKQVACEIVNIPALK